MLILLPAGAVAALGQALIPYYTGQIIDYASIDQKFDDFQRTCLLLIAVAFGTAVFTGDLTSPSTIAANAPPMKAFNPSCTMRVSTPFSCSNQIKAVLCSSTP